VLEHGREVHNGSRAASYEMSLAHQPSTVASMLVKNRHRSGKGVDHQRHLNTAEAAEMRRQDVVTTSMEPPRLSNASQKPFRTREMLAHLQEGAKAAEGGRVTRGKPEGIESEATEKMVAASPKDTTMLSQRT
jgi:hypothetical protein